MREVVIVPTGTANLASVQAAFRRLGARPRLSDDPAAILEASHVMLPGVGAFGAARRRLRDSGADRALRARIERDRPTLAICVGHQLLFRASAESPGVDGLGVVDAVVEAFPAGVRTPQFGWNEVTADEDCLLLESGWFYFANSYRAVEAPGFQIARADHGGPFIAAMERGRLIGCQFHPELSAHDGAALLARFLELD